MEKQCLTISSGPISKDTQYQLNVIGPYGAKEISMLIKKLTLDYEMFFADELTPPSDGDK